MVPPSWIEQLGPQAQPRKLRTLLKERQLWWEKKSSQRWSLGEENLPHLKPEEIQINWDSSQMVIQSLRELNATEKKQLETRAQNLIPWKKGPFQLFHLYLDGEWRCDQKWKRMEKHLISLKGKSVLDIGCNNGYFLFRAAAPQYGAKMLLGIDPIIPFKAQFDFIQHYARIPHLSTELLGIEELALMPESFDLCFFMGIIYHHRNPIEQLRNVHEVLKPGGQVILETLGIPGKESTALFPPDRYARMKNIWFIPTLSCFINWAVKAKFRDVQILADTPLYPTEQRLTSWCPPPRQSLQDSLNPSNPQLTLEGHPAPRRFMLSARKKK